MKHPLRFSLSNLYDIIMLTYSIFGYNHKKQKRWEKNQANNSDGERRRRYSNEYIWTRPYKLCENAFDLGLWIE